MNIQYKLAVASLALGLAAAHPAAAADIDLVKNGSFSQTTYAQNSQFGTGYGGQGVTSWLGNGGYNIFYFGGTASTVSASNQWGSPYETLYNVSASPTGGNFVALDGDDVARGGISQMISGLVVGETYTLTFDWGAGQLKSRTGNTTEQLQVSLGNETYLTTLLSNPSGSFSGWFSESVTFTANAASELLSFLSIGTPSGLPPVAVLADVSLKHSAVPEPASMALLLPAFGALALMRRRTAAR